DTPISAKDRRVVIIGGGDTAADCLGTANRQGALEVRQLDHNPRPPETRDDLTNPWPQVAKVHKTSPAHEEGVIEEWSRETVAFLGDATGRVCGLRTEVVERRVEPDGRRLYVPVPGSQVDIPADMVLLAAGFVGTDAVDALAQL